MAVFSRWAMESARKALASGPEAAARWSCDNPPIDIDGPPRVYRIPAIQEDCLVDEWLLSHTSDPVAFIASELEAHVQAVLSDK